MNDVRPKACKFIRLHPFITSELRGGSAISVSPYKIIFFPYKNSDKGGGSKKSKKALT